MPSRKRPNRQEELPVPATMRSGGATFPGTKDGKSVAADVSDHDGRLRELESKRIPALEKEVHGLKVMLATLAAVFTVILTIAGIVVPMLVK